MHGGGAAEGMHQIGLLDESVAVVFEHLRSNHLVQENGLVNLACSARSNLGEGTESAPI